MKLDEIKAEILTLCSTAPHSKDAMKRQIRAKSDRVAACAKELAQSGMIILGPQGTRVGYVTPAAIALVTPPSQPTANVPKLGAWNSPGQEISYSPNVKFVDGGRPPERWASDIKPGQGVISGDWVLRRQGADVPTRFGGLY